MGVTSPNSAKVGHGCLTLFGLPFLGGGLLAAYQVFQSLTEASPKTKETLLLALFALVFCGVGGGLILFARYAKDRVQETERLKQLHPDSPWMWEPDWASGQIKGANKATMVTAWIMAIFWNLVSAPALSFLPKEIQKGNHVAWVGLLFPIVGVGLLIWAFRATARWRKFGSSIFEVSSLPGVIGGRLRGTIQTGLKDPPQDGITLVLTCVRRRESRGRNSSSHERILWQEEYNVPREHLSMGYQGVTVPVEFVIPYECEQTDKSDRYNKILWRLRATAQVAGVDFQTQFEVPVFKTAESSAEPLPKSFATTFSGRVEEPFDPRHATIVISPSPLGGTEYFFGAARHIGPALAMTVITGLFGGGLWATIHFETPIIFPIATGFFTALLFLISLHLWFGTTRVAIESGTVKVRNALLGIGSTKQIPCSEIEDVTIRIGMQQSQTATQAGRPYYDIRIQRKNGKKVTAGQHLRNKREAEWLASEMKRQIQAFQ